MEKKTWSITNQAYIWTYSPFDEWEYSKENNKMVIHWDIVGDLNQYNTREEIKRKVKTLYHKDNPVNIVSVLDDFKNKLKKDDIIIAKIGSNQMLGYGIVLDDIYCFGDNRKKYKHTRNVQWIKTGEWIIPKELSMTLKTLTDITSCGDFAKDILKIMQNDIDLMIEKDKNQYTKKRLLKRSIYFRRKIYYNNSKSYRKEKHHIIRSTWSR